MADQFESKPLDKDYLTKKIQQYLRESSCAGAEDLLTSLEVLPNVASTNSFLLNQSIPVGSGKICIAESQSAGRGRHGNEWQSAPNRNLMMSISWGFASLPESISALSLAVGVVIAERLNKDYSLGVSLKWPNDILIGENKLAGILIEMNVDVNGPSGAIIGLGLNVHQPDWSHTESAYPWTDLHSHDVIVDRNDLAARITSDCIAMLPEFSEQGFASMIARWNALSAYNDQQVILRYQLDSKAAGNEIIGRLLGVDKTGALLVETAEGETEYITNSNYSLRPYTPDE